ncbi:zinc-binding dehydrogenase domain-containing protein [Ditylenchus destructor]|uniref:Enoyl-[acyl-carrier-protein] reductase, mitochondrial n=1 Tax=Ditylenchus destructor TaxID=166010 RepID=A0AAD4NCT7_9BILA|nr:zinc-binding dehydrogenase domain-containing protein [Ditylenchus destructor]
MPIMSKQIVYKEHGDPSKVLQLEDISLVDTSLQNSDVLVRWLAAPINPSDMYQIEGNFGTEPKLPAVGGNEGCGIIEKIGHGVSTVRPGDVVIPNGLCGLGTWRTHGIHNEKYLFKLDDAEGGLCPNIVGNCPLVAASMLINPPTAYRMLKEFVDLQRGDYVVQNGANSSVGRYVIQLCRIFGYKSINVIRNRPDVEGLKRDLNELGADKIYTQDEFVDIANDELKGVHLALDCVGGQAGAALTLALEEGGYFVSYGSMSGAERQKVTRKDIQVKSFAIAKWYNQRGNEKERRELYAEIGNLVQSGQLKGPVYTQRKITEFKEAIRASQEKSNTKQIFILGQCNTSRPMKSR